MAKRIIFATTISLLGSTCYAEGVIGMGISMYKPVCAYACHDSLSPLYLNCTTFDDDMSGMDMKVRKRMDMDSAMGMTSSACRAQDLPWLQTLAYCFMQRCGTEDSVPESSIEAAWSLLAADGDEVPAYQTSLPLTTPSTEVDSDAMWLNFTSLVNDSVYFATRQTYQEFEYQEDTHVVLSIIVICCTVGTCLAAGVYTAFKSSKNGNLLPNWLAKYLTIPALFSSYNQVPLPYNLGYAPSRIQSLMIFLYVFMNIIFCCVPYKSMWPVTYSVWYTSTTSEIATYVSNRTGVLSFANMALSILFAGRNNPILYISGLSQSTALAFHRWSARVSALQAVVHSIIYTLTYFWSGGAEAYHAEAAKAYYWWGIIATLALFLLTACSVLPLRKKFYEIFLITHIVLAILAVLGCWYHIQLRFATAWGYEVWLYVAISFWLFDRFARFVRIITYNWLGGSTVAFAELKGSGLIALTVYPCRSWKFGPGEHAFLYLPGIGRIWESHPFSIVGWSSGVSQSRITQNEPLPPLPPTDIEKQADAIEIAVEEASISSRQEQMASDPRPFITFLIRPSKGATNTLHEYLSKLPRTLHSIDVFIEGPYGHAAKLQNADRILCIGGGVGITALTGYVQRYVIARRAAKTATSRLLLAWTAREPEVVNIVRDLIPIDASIHGVELMLGCTASQPRVDVGGIIAAEAAGVKRLAVVVCGPPQMADEVRRQVVANTGKATMIELHIESFAW